MRTRHVTPKQDFVGWLKRDVEYDLTEAPNYMDKDLVAEITEDEADRLEEAATEMYKMCTAAVSKVVDENRFEEFGIGPKQAEYIKKTWTRGLFGKDHDPGLAGRFDFCWDGRNSIKFYEFNGDCYTTAYECGVVQWKVVEDMMQRGALPKGLSQFNSLDEKLTQRFGEIKKSKGKAADDTMSFTCASDYEEDLTTTNYLRYLAGQAGWKTNFIDVDHISRVDNPASRFYGKLFAPGDKEIKALYKLVPWEHIADGTFQDTIAKDKALIVEPAWKAILSNKRLSVLLWEMYPDHPLLLPAYDKPDKLGRTYVEKPIFGRIGAAIRVIRDGEVIGEKTRTAEDVVDYSKYPKIYQKFQPLPELPGEPGWRFQTGIWVVGDGQVAGMDLRRDKSLVTGSSEMHFLPHVMIPRQPQP